MTTSHRRKFLLLPILGVLLMGFTVIHAQSTDATISLANVTEISRIAQLGRGVAYDISSPTGELASGLAVASARGVWHYESGLSPDLTLLDPSPVAITSVAFAPRGTWLAAGGDDGSLRIYDLMRGADMSGMQFPSGMSPSIHFTTQEFPLIIESHLYRITDLAFNIGGYYLASADQSGVVRVWRIETAAITEMSVAQYAGAVSRLEFMSSDYLSVRTNEPPNDGFSPSLQFPTGESLPLLSDFFPPILALRTDADAQISAYYEDDVTRSWNIANLPVPMLPTRQTGTMGGNVINAPLDGAAEATQGDLTAIGGSDGVTRLYTTADPDTEIAAFYVHTRAVTALAYNPDASLLFSASLDRSIKVWDTSARGEVEPLLTLENAHNGGITSLAITPDGTRLISGGYDGVITVWGIS